MSDLRPRIRQLLRRAGILRREIVLLATMILIGDALAASECLRLLEHPTVRMLAAFATAIAVVVASAAVGRRLERELFLVRGEAARVLAAELQS